MAVSAGACAAVEATDWLNVENKNSAATRIVMLARSDNDHMEIFICLLVIMTL